MEYRREDHRVHLIVYHLIWCPKRRKPVLVDAVARDCDLLIRAKCAEQGWDVLALELQPDHVHLRVRVTPDDAAAEVAKAVKRYTSHVLRGRYPALLKLPSLWTRSYLASTAASISQTTIRRYVDAQKGV